MNLSKKKYKKYFVFKNWVPDGNKTSPMFHQNYVKRNFFIIKKVFIIY